MSRRRKSNAIPEGSKEPLARFRSGEKSIYEPNPKRRGHRANAIPSGSLMPGIKMKDGKFPRKDMRMKHDPLSDQKAGFGIEIEPLSLTLADRFLVPPFSVLDARQGYWQARKRLWLSLGIQSELGRGENEVVETRERVKMAMHNDPMQRKVKYDQTNLANRL